MLGRMAAGAALFALAACAGLEPAGRNASRTPAPPPPVSRPAPPPAATVSAPTPPPAAPAPAIQQAAPPVAQTPTPPPAAPVTTQRAPAAPPVASQATVPTPPPAPPSRPASADDDIVVPGQVESQVPAPRGDPRTSIERMEDIRAWDQCVMQVQSAFERDPMRPQLNSPEEYCGNALGMRDRTAVPESRRIRR